MTWRALRLRHPVAPGAEADAAAATEVEGPVTVGPTRAASVRLQPLAVARVRALGPAPQGLAFRRVTGGPEAGHSIVTERPTQLAPGTWLIEQPPGTASDWLISAPRPVQVIVEGVVTRSGDLIWEHAIGAVLAWVDEGGPVPPLPEVPGAIETRDALLADAEIAAALWREGRDDRALRTAVRAWQAASAVQRLTALRGPVRGPFGLELRPRALPGATALPVAREAGWQRVRGAPVHELVLRGPGVLWVEARAVGRGAAVRVTSQGRQLAGARLLAPAPISAEQAAKPAAPGMSPGTGAAGQVGKDMSPGTGASGQVGKDMASGTGASGQVGSADVRGAGVGETAGVRGAADGGGGAAGGGTAGVGPGSEGLARGEALGGRTGEDVDLGAGGPAAAGRGDLQLGPALAAAAGAPVGAPAVLRVALAPGLHAYRVAFAGDDVLVSLRAGRSNARLATWLRGQDAGALARRGRRALRRSESPHAPLVAALLAEVLGEPPPGSGPTQGDTTLALAQSLIAAQADGLDAVDRVELAKTLARRSARVPAGPLAWRARQVGLELIDVMDQPSLARALVGSRPAEAPTAVIERLARQIGGPPLALRSPAVALFELARRRAPLDAHLRAVYRDHWRSATRWSALRADEQAGAGWTWIEPRPASDERVPGARSLWRWPNGQPQVVEATLPASTPDRAALLRLYAELPAGGALALRIGERRWIAPSLAPVEAWRVALPPGRHQVSLTAPAAAVLWSSMPPNPGRAPDAHLLRMWPAAAGETVRFVLPRGVEPGFVRLEVRALIDADRGGPATGRVWVARDDEPEQAIDLKLEGLDPAVVPVHAEARVGRRTGVVLPIGPRTHVLTVRVEAGAPRLAIAASIRSTRAPEATRPLAEATGPRPAPRAEDAIAAPVSRAGGAAVAMLAAPAGGAGPGPQRGRGADRLSRETRGAGELSRGTGDEARVGAAAPGETGAGTGSGLSGGTGAGLAGGTGAGAGGKGGGGVSGGTGAGAGSGMSPGTGADGLSGGTGAGGDGADDAAGRDDAVRLERLAELSRGLQARPDDHALRLARAELLLDLDQPGYALVDWQTVTEGGLPRDLVKPAVALADRLDALDAPDTIDLQTARAEVVAPALAAVIGGEVARLNALAPAVAAARAGGPAAGLAALERLGLGGDPPAPRAGSTRPDRGDPGLAAAAWALRAGWLDARGEADAAARVWARVEARTGSWQAGLMGVHSFLAALDGPSWRPGALTRPAAATPTADGAALAYGLALSVRRSVRTPAVQRLATVAATRSRWSRIDGTERDAGAEGLRIPRAPALPSPNAAVRQALLVPPWPHEDATLLRPGYATVLSLRRDAVADLAVELWCQTVRPDLAAGARPRVRVVLDGAELLRGELPTGEVQATAVAALPAGRHRVEVELAADSRGQLCSVRLRDAAGPVASARPTLWRVARPGQPVEAVVLGPTTLAVEARAVLGAGEARAQAPGEPDAGARELKVAVAGAAGPFEPRPGLALVAEGDPRATPEPGRTIAPGRAGARVLVLAEPGPHRVLLATERGSALVRLQQRVDGEPTPVRRPPVRALDLGALIDEVGPIVLPRASAPTVAERRPPAQRFGTTFAELRGGSDDLEGSDDLQPRLQGQVRVGWARELLRRRLWILAAPELRLRDGTALAGGGQLALQAVFPAAGIRGRAAGGAVAQDDPGGPAWGAFAALRVDRPTWVAPRVQLLPSLELLLRQQSLGPAAAQADTPVNPRVFTSYAGTHPVALRPGLELRYQPWQDARLYAATDVVPNSDFRSLDQANLRGGIVGVMALLTRAVPEFALEYEASLRLRDAHRAASYVQHRARAAVGVGVWAGRAARVVVGVGDTLVASSRFPLRNVLDVWLRVDLVLGRGLRDYGPLDLAFRPVREHRLWLGGEGAP
jgi:hypothetical protein